MSLSAVFKYMANQAVDCRNTVRVKVWHTHTTVWLLQNYSQRILAYYARTLLLDLMYGRTMMICSIQSVPVEAILNTLGPCVNQRRSEMRSIR